MCDPISIIAGGALAAGSAIKSHEANQNAKRQINARNAATREELARQKVYQDQSGALFDDALGIFGPGVLDRISGAKAGAGDFIRSNAPTEFGSINTGTAPRAAQALESSTIADMMAKDASRSAAMGNLLGYDQFNFDAGLGLGDTGRRIGTIGNLAANSANVGGLEQVVNANNAYKPPSGLGDLLVTAGQLGSFYGGRGGTTLPTQSAVPIPRPNPLFMP